MPEIISRKEAKALGLKRYFTGKPCKHGHLCERCQRGNCLECKRIKNANRTPLTEQQRFSATECHRRWTRQNLEKIRVQKKIRREMDRQTKRLLFPSPPRPSLTKEERYHRHFLWRMRPEIREYHAAQKMALRKGEPDRLRKYARKNYDRGRAAQLALRELGILVCRSVALRTVKMLGISL